MCCSSNRKKQTRDFAEQKWDYINLQDFKAKGCGPGFAYAYLWFMLFISIAVYAVDSFTAMNLLAFNRWSSKIEPAIPFDISKWIFSVCILLSFVNLAFEGGRAIRVMRRGNVAECFLDSLTVRWESIRMGQGQGWKRFLVFAELAKSKKGSEYVALFTFFSFKSWIRVIFCSGPRQVVNAMTLRSVYQTKLAPTATSVDGAILGFFDKIKVLASEDYQQAVILSGMCFTLLIWVFSALFLLMAVLFYVFFLFYWIPRADGGLTGYCERKVNKKLLRIVATKVNKALAKGEANRIKAEVEFAKRNGEKVADLERAATLPTLPNVQGGHMEDGLSSMPAVRRDDETSTLPLYTSRPGSPGSFEMGSMGGRHRMQRRAAGGSTSSFSSRAPLTSCAAEMGYGQSPRSPTLPDMDLGSVIASPDHTRTPASQRGFPNSRPGFAPTNTPSMATLRTNVTSPATVDHNGSQHPGYARSFTSRSVTSNATAPAAMGGMRKSSMATVRTNATSPATVDYNASQYSGHARSLTNQSVSSDATAPPAMGGTSPGPMAYQQYNGHHPGGGAGRAPSAAPPFRSAAAGGGGGAPPPGRSVTGPAGSMHPPRGAPPMPRPPPRNMTAPVPGNDGGGWQQNSRQGPPAPTYRGAPYGHDAASQQHTQRRH